MTTEGAAAAEELYKLFLMGLAWLRQEDPEKLSRPGASVFWSYVCAAALPRSAKILAEQSWDLMELVQENSEIIEITEGEKPPGQRELRQLIGTSLKHNIVLVSPPGDLAPELAFGPHGYRHVITEAGLEHAASVAPGYARVVTKESFLLGWRKFKAQMRNLNSKKPLSSSSVIENPGEGPSEGDFSNRYIPPPPDYPDEW